jgi:hypothetical protein
MVDIPRFVSKEGRKGSYSTAKNQKPYICVSMNVRIANILTVFLIFLCYVAIGQKSKPHPRTHKAHTTERSGKSIAKTSKNKSKISSTTKGKSTYPFQGIGFKLGDPFALTYKYYFDESFAIVADIGKTSSGLYNRYYREKFGNYVFIDTLQDGVEIQYLGHSVKNDIVGEVKFLWQIDAKSVSPGLKIYVGIGPEIKSTSLEYFYLYKNNNNGVSETGNFTRKRITFGPQVTLGIEYAYFQIPLSAFMELEFYNDISIDTGWRRFEGGVGLRYLF